MQLLKTDASTLSFALLSSTLNPPDQEKSVGCIGKGRVAKETLPLPHSQLDYPKLGLPELVYLPLLPSDDGDMGGVNLHTLLTSVTVSIHSQMLLSLTRD